MTTKTELETALNHSSMDAGTLGVGAAGKVASRRIALARAAIEKLTAELDHLEADAALFPQHWGVTGTAGHYAAKLIDLTNR
jgi:hypothetical protein